MRDQGYFGRRGSGFFGSNLIWNSILTKLYRTDVLDVAEHDAICRSPYSSWGFLTGEQTASLYLASWLLVATAIGFAIHITMNCRPCLEASNFRIVIPRQADITYLLGNDSSSPSVILRLILCFLFKASFFRWLKSWPSWPWANMGPNQLSDAFRWSGIWSFFTGVWVWPHRKAGTPTICFMWFWNLIFQKLIRPARFWLSILSLRTMEWLWRNLSYMNKCMHCFEKGRNKRDFKFFLTLNKTQFLLKK